MPPIRRTVRGPTRGLTALPLLFFALLPPPAAAASDPFSGLDAFLERSSDLTPSRGDVPFYAGVGFSPGTPSERSVLYVTVALPVSGLRFLRADGGMAARCRISVFWKNLSSGLSDETVRNRRFARPPDVGWSSRFDPFQVRIPLDPGRYRVEVEVEDRNARRYGHASREVDVPDFAGEAAALSSIFLLSPGGSLHGLECRATEPAECTLNAVSAYPYAVGSIPYQIGGVGVPAGPGGPFGLRVAVIDSAGTTRSEQRCPLSGASGGFSCVGAVGGEGLPIGRYRLRAEFLDPKGGILAARERPFFIASSERWIVDHYVEIADYIEAIAGKKELDEMRAAPVEERVRLWRKFWERRDPLPATPANEALEEFFDRLRYVRRRFATHLEPGWKTDRGRVFLTLGPPDERLFRERNSAFGSWEIWVYDRSIGFRTTLYFEDRGFTGDYRLVNPGAFVQARSKIR